MPVSISYNMHTRVPRLMVIAQCKETILQLAIIEALINESN